MSDKLEQSEADALIAMEKFWRDKEPLGFPSPGERLNVQLSSEDGRENFILDVNRGRITVTKATFQNRVRTDIVLVRLDLDGRPHRNPDGEIVPCPHIHLYREGYGDKWAEPVPQNFHGINDIHRLLELFMDYCNIVRKPEFQLKLPI